jgi:hypothetical protein
MDLYLVKTHVYLDNDRWIAVDLELYESDQAAIEAGFTQKDCDRARAVATLNEIDGLAGRLQCVPMTREKGTN